MFDIFRLFIYINKSVCLPLDTYACVDFTLSQSPAILSWSHVMLIMVTCYFYHGHMLCYHGHMLLLSWSHIIISWSHVIISWSHVILSWSHVI